GIDQLLLDLVLRRLWHGAVSCLSTVMAGLVPAIHVFLPESKAWMPGTRPGMTGMRLYSTPALALAGCLRQAWAARWVPGIWSPQRATTTSSSARARPAACWRTV